MKQSLEKTKKPLIFAIIGVFNTAVDFGLLLFLNSTGLSRVVANTISTGVAFIFSFFLNRKYTFKSSSKHIVREITLFILVTLFGLWVIQNYIIWILAPFIVAQFGASNEAATLVAKLFATIASLIWNYLMYDRVVFRTKKQVA
jgi:putative flippase GtrA